jgi:hypothetical protein
MIDVIRDFNTPTNDIGEITVYLTNKKNIRVTILNVHEHGYYDVGQAWLRIKNPHNIDIYDAFLTILNTITHDIFQELLNIIRAEGNLDPEITVASLTPNYRDIIPIDDNNPTSEPVFSGSHWGDYVPFTRESVQFLEEVDWDDEDDAYDIGEYVIYGEILENGELFYDKTIRSHDYRYVEDNNTDSETDSDRF